MKKLINVLTGFTVVTSASSFIVGCEGWNSDSKENRFKSGNKQYNTNDPNVVKVKNYIDEELHICGNFDFYSISNSDRHFYANQHYKDVVDVVKNYVKLFCKKENLDLVKVELNESNEMLSIENNVIKIKLTLNDQSDETTIILGKVRKASENKKTGAVTDRVKNYIDEELHCHGFFDGYYNTDPDRQFYANQHHKDVVDVVSKYVKLFCKKEDLGLVKVDLDESDVLLGNGKNVINIKLTLNGQLTRAKINLTNVKAASENKKTGAVTDRVKNYIDKELHKYDNLFDKYVASDPDRQFYTNQHYKDVVDVVSKYVKLFCKKEDLGLVKVDLDESDVLLGNGENVINIKLTLNGQLTKAKINLTNVKEANPLAAKIMEKNYYFTNDDFYREATFEKVPFKIKKIYNSDFDTSSNWIRLNSDKILPSTVLKQGENIVPLEIKYNAMFSKINVKVNLVTKAQFSEYETNRVINELLVDEEGSYQINPNIFKRLPKIFKQCYLVEQINNFLRDKNTKVRVKLYDSLETTVIYISSTNKIKLDVYLDGYSKKIELEIN